MKHFIIALKTNTGKIAEVRMLSTTAAITDADILPYSFTDADVARAYVVQLEQHNGIFSIAQRQAAPPKRKSVKNVSSGELFASATRAAKSIGVSGSYMVRELKRGQGTANVKGSVFAYPEYLALRGM